MKKQETLQIRSELHNHKTFNYSKQNILDGVGKVE